MSATYRAFVVTGLAVNARWQQSGEPVGRGHMDARTIPWLECFSGCLSKKSSWMHDNTPLPGCSKSNTYEVRDLSRYVCSAIKTNLCSPTHVHAHTHSQRKR